MTRWLVVGGGSAGCVVAARLSEIESNDVTLLEAGPDHGPSQSGVGPIGADGAVSRSWGSGAQNRDAARERGSGAVSQSQAWGAQNRDTADVRRGGEGAADETGPGRWAEVVRRVGDRPSPYLQGFGLGGSSLVNGSVVVGPEDEWSHGHELPVEPAVVGPVGEAVLSARPDAATVGVIGRAGVRVSAADAYLRPALVRSNLRVRTGMRIDRIVFDGRRAVGAVVNGVEFLADRVVLCAGAIESPAILLRSGVDTPGVGAGLQDHVGVAIAFDLPDPDPDPDGADRTVSPIGVTVERPGSQMAVIDRLPEAPAMGALLAGHLDVTSRGAVTLGDDGAIAATLHQLSTPADRNGLESVAADAVELVQDLTTAGAVGTAYVDDHGTPIDALRNEAALRRWLPDHLGGYHHVAGSCHRALTGGGWLRGYDGIAVCDAAALAGPPARNPYITLIRHAEAMVQRWVS